MIKDNLKRINNDIHDACKKALRETQDVTLVGVTKFADISQINEAIQFGLKNIGENKVQSAAGKFHMIDECTEVCKHMIGHLQTNKVKQALDLFDIIESVDSLKLAAEINKQSANRSQVADILIQVNTAVEVQKFGLNPENVDEFMQGVLELENVNVKGFMAIAPFDAQESIIRSCFSDLRKIQERIAKEYKNLDFNILSMGMSDDFKIAIEEGSNMVRIGRAIFQ